MLWHNTMPSLLHESLIELVRGEPRFAADLVTKLLHVEVPDFAEARLADSALNEVIPVEYRADAVVVLVNPAPVFGVIIEAQREPDPRKRFTWPVYVTTARAHHECPFILIVVTPSQATATWSEQPIPIGGTMVHRPYVVGPDGIPKITDRERALHQPQLALLSLLAHGQGDVDIAVAIAQAVAAAIEGFPDDQRQLYSGMIESALSNAAREELAMAPQAHRLFSDSQRRSFAEGEAKGKVEGKAEGKVEGKAEGKADSVLKVLAQRGIAITDTQRRQITECMNLELLDSWMDRILSVTSIDELLR